MLRTIKAAVTGGEPGPQGICKPESHAQVRGLWTPTDHQIISHRLPKPQSCLNSLLKIEKDHHPLLIS